MDIDECYSEEYHHHEDVDMENSNSETVDLEMKYSENSSSDQKNKKVDFKDYNASDLTIVPLKEENSTSLPQRYISAPAVCENSCQTENYFASTEASPLLNSKSRHLDDHTSFQLSRSKSVDCLLAGTTILSSVSSSVVEKSTDVLERIFLFFANYSKAVIRLLFTAFCLYGFYLFFSLAESDYLTLLNEAYLRQEEKQRGCRKSWESNLCAPETRIPYLEDQCREFELCMKADPYEVSHKTVLVVKTLTTAIEQVGQNLSWKTLGVFGCILLGLKLILGFEWGGAVKGGRHHSVPQPSPVRTRGWSGHGGFAGRRLSPWSSGARIPSMGGSVCYEQMMHQSFDHSPFPSNRLHSAAEVSNSHGDNHHEHMHSRVYLDQHHPHFSNIRHSQSVPNFYSAH
eukprot:GDKJ01018522.1.p1 GENE.GDKJ01018522.1~~GDKJ01018522.1.p1  ORF type:complete len:400 (-),score=54.35 GDKJ01018522.1:50-1249(-)